MIDLNADLGEGTGNDQQLLGLVTSASIACGGHAGDIGTMTAALRAAKANGVRIGAHPGFNDRENFGRLRLSLPVQEIIGQVLSQIQDLKEVADREGSEISYLKLHGALANMAADDETLSREIFSSVAERFEGLAMMVLEGSGQHRAAEHLGLPVVLEAYADRAYTADGLLVPRSESGSVIHDPQTIVDRCLRLARAGEIVAVDGSVLVLKARSICVHGDTPGGLQIARAVEAALREAGFLFPRP